MDMKMKIDPWGTLDIEDYSKLFDEFGISPIEDVYSEISSPHKFIRRNIVFGHRNYNLIVDAMNKGEPFSVISGFMPSGMVHLGGKMVMDEIIWHQQMGANAFVGIADREAYAVRGLSWDKCRELGINEYILSLIALGFEPDGHIYFQSECDNVKNMAFELGSKTNYSELSAIYGFGGETNVSHMISTLTQSADILQPQLKEFGGPKPTVVPVGADQDPHIRLTRGLAHKMNMLRIETREDNNGNQYFSIRNKSAPEYVLKQIKKRAPGKSKVFEGHVDIFETDDFETILDIVLQVELEAGGYSFVPPVATYHRFMSGLQGGKMSSSDPDSYIALTDDPKEGAKKVKRSKTGGCISLEEQKRLGGNPKNCSVYELLMFHLIDDDKQLTEIYDECVSGTRMCGSCKKYTAELMSEFLKDHQEKRELAKERLDEYGLGEYRKYVH